MKNLITALSKALAAQTGEDSADSPELTRELRMILDAPIVHPSDYSPWLSYIDETAPSVRLNWKTGREKNARHLPSSYWTQ